MVAPSQQGPIFCGRRGQMVKQRGRFVHLAALEARAQVWGVIPLQQRLFCYEFSCMPGHACAAGRILAVAVLWQQAGCHDTTAAPYVHLIA
jgi:hypothetical protein